MTETATFQHLYDDLLFLKERIFCLERDLQKVTEEEPEVREEYLKRLAKIEKEKGKIFQSKEKFLHFLEHEL